MGFSLLEPWIMWSFVLYLFMGACWLPVVAIQVKLRDLARAARVRTPLPAPITGCSRLVHPRLAGLRQHDSDFRSDAYQSRCSYPPRRFSGHHHPELSLQHRPQSVDDVLDRQSRQQHALEPRQRRTLPVVPRPRSIGRGAGTPEAERCDRCNRPQGRR